MLTYVLRGSTTFSYGESHGTLAEWGLNNVEACVIVHDWTKNFIQIIKGFTDWKDAAAKILQHEQSEHHQKAHEELYIWQVQDVGELLSSSSVRKKVENRIMLDANYVLDSSF